MRLATGLASARAGRRSAGIRYIMDKDLTEIDNVMLRLALSIDRSKGGNQFNIYISDRVGGAH